MDHAVERLRDFPNLFHSELPNLRLASCAKLELADRGAGKRAPTSFGENCYLGGYVGSRLEVAELLAFLATALVTGADAAHGAVLNE